MTTDGPEKYYASGGDSLRDSVACFLVNWWEVEAEGEDEAGREGGREVRAV